MKYGKLTPASSLIVGILVLAAAAGGILLGLAVTNGEPQDQLAFATNETQDPLANGDGEPQDPLEILDHNMSIYEADSAAMLKPNPTDMDVLVDKSDVILIGKVDSVLASHAIGSYNEADNLRIRKSTDPVSSDIPVTDYNIQVQRVFLNDGALGSSNALTLRMLGTYDDEETFPSILRMLQPGDERLFALGRNPDGKSYGLKGWWAHFIIDGEKITYADDLRTPIGFTDKVKPEDFFKDLQAAIDRSNKTKQESEQSSALRPADTLVPPTLTPKDGRSLGFVQRLPNT